MLSILVTITISLATRSWVVISRNNYIDRTTSERKCLWESEESYSSIPKSKIDVRTINPILEKKKKKKKKKKALKLS